MTSGNQLALRRSKHSLSVLVVAVAVLLSASAPAWASLLWNWRCTGTGVSASGTFTTDSKPDAHGFHRITGINGAANGGAITALQPEGTPIPGNSGFPVDNLVRSSAPQLTMHGFGFAVSNGEYHNPFHKKAYLDYVSRPPYVDGAGTETNVRFTATLVSKRPR